ncbi:MAG: hypothetical protein ABIJ59_02610 [Pseudomonadota bacterium]
MKWNRLFEAVGIIMIVIGIFKLFLGEDGLELYFGGGFMVFIIGKFL